jgi:hypothetical protein
VSQGSPQLGHLSTWLCAGSGSRANMRTMRVACATSAADRATTFLTEFWIITARTREPLSRTAGAREAAGDPNPHKPPHR